MKKLCLRIFLCLIAISLFSAIQAESQYSLSQPTRKTVQNELPECSWLRKAYVEAREADRPYMAAMQKTGVKRAFLEANLIWHHDRPSQIRIVRRLYFSAFDGPNAEITDAEKLAKLKNEGFDSDLDTVVMERIKSAGLYGGPDGQGIKHPEGKPMYSYVELFSTQQLKEQKTFISPRGKRDELAHAAYLGDMIGLKLEMTKGDERRDLNGALLQAVLNPYDNTQVIEFLVGHGANINFHGPNGITPLINAVPQTCNLESLLKLGARPEEKDKWGRTALKVAIESKHEDAANILRASSLKSE